MLQYIFINMSFCYRMFPYYLLYNKIHILCQSVLTVNQLQLYSYTQGYCQCYFEVFFAGDLHYNAQIKEHRRNLSFP